MSGPMAEGGPIPEPDRDLIAQHEVRLLEWEIAESERRISEWESELDDRLARAIRAYHEGTLHSDGRPIPGQ